MKLLFSGFLFVVSASVAFSQQVTISGKVSSATDGESTALAGVNITVQNTTFGTSTGTDGSFSIAVDRLPVVLSFSFIGYQRKIVTIETNRFLEIVLDEGVLGFQDIVVTGSRFSGVRTSITSPVPVDNIRTADLRGTAQVSFDKMLHYVVPSFNSTQQTISDATAHFDPADLRGLGPSRTLVLVNGKRKNQSALVYINDTPGKGDVGVDMGSIPVSAIKRIEVLRDGASAQYGSDAIAGVINIILNDEIEQTTVNAFSGATHEGDGFQFGGSVNTGMNIGERGFLNLTTGYSDQEETNRAPSPGGDGLFGVIFEDDAILNGTHPWLRANPDMGMHVGLPNMKSANVYFNSEIGLNENSEVYSFGGLVYRQGLSYALYRAPYWIPDEFFIKHTEGTEYQGFQPTFETDIFDAQWTFGFRSQKSGWNYDLSYSYGSNVVDYTVGNSINLDMAENSPTEFDPGGYEFKNSIINFDVSKLLFEKLFVSAGTEFRQENFITNAGEEASYLGGGAQSFPGLQPQNAVDAKRTNVGAYLDIGVDATENFFLGGAARFEDYSDFGTSSNYKLNARLKTTDDRLSLRGSLSTGFRAPSLHQIHLSNIQTLISGGTVSNQGTFDNDSPVLRKLGVEKLKEENATNFSFGIAGNPVKDFFFSADYFKIDVDDRIFYSGEIASSDPNATVGRILSENNITSLKFFINAVNTSTKGVDLVAVYRLNNLKLNGAASFYDHSIEGRINTPAVIAAEGIDIFNRKEQSRLLSARPNQKIILGAAYEANPFTLGVTGTHFGEVTWQHASDPAKDQTFSSKILIDLNANYQLTNEISLSLLVNNLFSVYPDKLDPKGDFVTDLGGRFQYPWEVNQFGFNGRVVLGSTTIRF